MDNRGLTIFQKNLKKNTKVRIKNILNNKTVIAKVGNNSNYPLFNNSVILFLIFTIFIYLINKLNYLNFNNIYLFFIIILFNIQYTIYHKYFDPLLLFLFLFLFDFKQNKNLNLSKISKNYFILYSFFLLISFGKTYINY